MTTRAWKLARDIELRPVLVSCLSRDRVNRLLLALRQDEDGSLLDPEALRATEEIFGESILEWKIGRR